MGYDKCDIVKRIHWISPFFFVVFVLTLRRVNGDGNLVSKLDISKFSVNEKRFILYDVNHGEGFNLRRDVYMRMATFVRNLRQSGHNFVLVLPPWGALYHWQSKILPSQIKIPWHLFFDLESLNRFVPVIEFEDYLKEVGAKRIETVFYLQAYAEGWTHWEEKWSYRPCIDQNYYFFDPNLQLYGGWFFGYDDIYAKRFNCISIQGHASMLNSIVLAENETSQSILFDRAETVLHDTFGDKTYWQARRSMRYNRRLVEISDEFRRLELKSNDLDDRTKTNVDWTKDKIIPGAAIGGPYLCVHWRRKDFVRAHSKELPSIMGTANQIMKLLDQIGLDLIFLSTDASEYEVDELSSYLPSNISIKRYVPPLEILQSYMDGGISIIDQWICSHARHFIGTHVSTFSFRIQEDREILGFSPSTTFNRLCPDNVTDCEQPSRWTIVL